MESFPVHPEIWEDERIRECLIYHESSQISSSLTLWMHRDIVLYLSLDMHQATLKHCFRIHFLKCCNNPNSSICRTWDNTGIPHLIPEKSEILSNVFFLLSISYTEPDNLLDCIRIVDEQYLFRSVSHLGKPISINHDMMYVWIYLTNAGNIVLIKTKLDILPYSIFHEFLLFCKLSGWISFTNILFEYIRSTGKIFLPPFFTSNETKETVFTLQFWTSALIVSIFLQIKRTTLRAFFLA